MIEIPSWNICKTGDDEEYVTYRIHVYMKSGVRWVVDKRFSEFRNLRDELNLTRPELREEIFFPRKRLKLFFNLQESFLNERKDQLCSYLQSLVDLDNVPPELDPFLNVKDYIWEFAKGGPSLVGRKSKPLDSTSIADSFLSDTVTINDFQLLKVLGKGSFGKVFLVRMLGLASLNSKIYAMKVLSKYTVEKRKQVEHTKAERLILEMVDHPFLLNLRYAFQTDEKLYMITDYCPGGELFFHLKQMRKFTEGMVRFYTAQMAMALQYMHDNKILYRDLKPENVLLDKDGYIKITDYGLSKVIFTEEDRPQTFCGTPEYLAPEMILHRRKGSGYDFNVDWWSLGIVAFELLTGFPPFLDKDFEKMCSKILSKSVSFPVKSPPTEEIKEFIHSLLQRNPYMRLGYINGLREVKGAKFFAEIDFDQLYHKQSYPPFRPLMNSRNYLDTRNFDRQFTNMKPKESVEDSKYSPARRLKKWSSKDNLVEYNSFSFRSTSFVD